MHLKNTLDQKHLLTEEEFRQGLAPKHARVFASCTDYLIYFLVLSLLYGQLYNPSSTGVGFGINLINPNPFISIAIWLLLFPLPEGFKGQTLGKRLFRIRVLSHDHSTASYGQCFVRHLLDIIDWLPFFGVAGLIAASINKKNQRIGDLLAKTIVVDSLNRKSS